MPPSPSDSRALPSARKVKKNKKNHEAPRSRRQWFGAGPSWWTTAPFSRCCAASKPAWPTRRPTSSPSPSPPSPPWCVEIRCAPAPSPPCPRRWNVLGAAQRGPDDMPWARLGALLLLPCTCASRRARRNEALRPLRPSLSFAPPPRRLLLGRLLAAQVRSLEPSGVPKALRGCAADLLAGCADTKKPLREKVPPLPDVPLLSHVLLFFCFPCLRCFFFKTMRSLFCVTTLLPFYFTDHCSESRERGWPLFSLKPPRKPRVCC